VPYCPRRNNSCCSAVGEGDRTAAEDIDYNHRIRIPVAEGVVLIAAGVGIRGSGSSAEQEQEGDLMVGLDFDTFSTWL